MNVDKKETSATLTQTQLHTHPNIPPPPSNFCQLIHTKSQIVKMGTDELCG